MKTGAAPPDLKNFKMAFDPRDMRQVFACWEEIFANQQWTDGKFTRFFEERWAGLTGLDSVAVSNWLAGAEAALEYFKVRGKKVLCPSNTFMATPISVIRAGGEVIFGDCGREDLCLTLGAVARAAERHDLAAVWLVHIGGHIAFDTPQIAAFCRKKGIALLEDCAHAHGAEWNGRKAGSWGDAGVYSFYATKSLPTGEGGMLVSRHPGLIAFAKAYRAYGGPDFATLGINGRMSEFTAALGYAQAGRLAEIVARKNETARRTLDVRYSRRVRLPAGMVSGYYKYIVFEPVENSTSKVYAKPCHRILGREDRLPDTDWAAENHWCVPLYYERAI